MAGRGGIILPKVVDSGVFAKSGDLERRLKTFVDGVESSVISAAATATTTSRSVFNSSQLGTRPFVPDRPKRRSTHGKFAEYINWIPHRVNGEMVVDVDLARLDAATSMPDSTGPGYWLIQEIGTGKSAYIGGHAPWERRVTVKSQMGRAIPFGLVWADSGGQFQHASQQRYGQDQLVAAAAVTQFPNRHSAGTIGREIEGKHFLRDGGLAGYTQFRSNALAVAKQAFAGRPRR